MGVRITLNSLTYVYMSVVYAIEINIHFRFVIMQNCALMDALNSQRLCSHLPIRGNSVQFAHISD